MNKRLRKRDNKQNNFQWNELFYIHYSTTDIGEGISIKILIRWQNMIKFH